MCASINSTSMQILTITGLFLATMRANSPGPRPDFDVVGRYWIWWVAARSRIPKPPPTSARCLAATLIAVKSRSTFPNPHVPEPSGDQGLNFAIAASLPRLRCWLTPYITTAARPSNYYVALFTRRFIAWTSSSLIVELSRYDYHS
jgi:hypothetical protein